MPGTRLRFGVNLNTKALVSDTASVRSMVDYSKLAEDLGYDSVWVGDSPWQADPSPVLSCVALSTARIRLGVACYVLPLRHPVTVAQSWSTLDLLSGGRAIIAFCTGGPKYNALLRSMGIMLDERIARLEEGVGLLKRLWGEEAEVSSSGKYYPLKGLSFGPKPVQRPHPPLLVATNDVELVRRMSVGWMVDTNRGWTPEKLRDKLAILAEGGRAGPKDTPDVALHLLGNISSDRQVALQQASSFLFKHYHGAYEGRLAGLGAFGTPEDWRRAIGEWAAAGVSRFIIRFASPDLDAQLRTFAKDVLPELS